MKRRNETCLKDVALRTVLTVLATAVSVGVVGCNEQLTAIEQNQVRLQEMMQGSSRQMADNTVAIEKSQVSLQDRMESNTQEMAENVAVLQQNQLELRNEIKEQFQRMMNDIAMIENNQSELRGGIINNGQRVSESSAIFEQNLAQLHAMIQNMQDSTQDVAGKVAVIEKNQLELQGAIEGDIRQVAGNIEAIERELLKLQEMVSDVRNNTQNAAEKLDTVEENRLKWQGRIDSSIRGVLRSIEAIERSNKNVLPGGSSAAIPVKPSLHAADTR